MDIFRESRQAAPNHERADSLLKTVCNHGRIIRILPESRWTLSDETATHHCQCLNQCESCTSLFMLLSVSPWLPNGIAKTLVLAASGDVRGRLADEGIFRPALRKKGIHKLIASWSSFIAHPTMDNACVCQSCDSRTVLSLRSSLSWTTQLQELHP